MKIITLTSAGISKSAGILTFQEIEEQGMKVVYINSDADREIEEFFKNVNKLR